MFGQQELPGVSQRCPGHASFIPLGRLSHGRVRAGRLQARKGDGDEESSKSTDDSVGAFDSVNAWLDGMNATYSKQWSGEPYSAEDIQRDLDFSAANSLLLGVFDSYVKVAPAAQPPDCISYTVDGACCPSFECYKELPLGIKIGVALTLFLTLRGSVRMLSVPGLSNANIGKCLLIFAVATQITRTLFF